MKKNRTLFIYSFLCVSCISFSQLYAARPKFSSLPQFFREGLKEDEEKSDFVKTVLERLNKTNYKWLALKEDSFVALTNVTFRDLTQKEAYKTFLEKALEDAKNNLSAQEKLRGVGILYLVYQGERLSYYVGGKGDALSLFTKVSEDEYKQFSGKNQAKRILLDTESLRALLSQEFQADNALEQGVKQEETLGTLKQVLFPGEKMIKNLSLESIKAGSFFLYSRKKSSENSFNSALNEMFGTIQARAKGLGPFVIGKTETFEYSLQQGKNARLHVKFRDSEKFKNYLKNNNENNPMEVSDHEELESLSHEELESLSHEELESLSHEELESLKHADLLKIRKNHINTIKKDLEMKPDRSSCLTNVYTLPDKTAVIYGLKTQEETDCSYLSYKIKRSLTAENKKKQIFKNEQNNWEYWYLPLNKTRIYIKVPSDVGEIFKKTTKQNVYKPFDQAACKQVILDDIHEGNDIAQMLNSTNDAVKLKQVFGMNDMTHELSNIALFMPGNVLRVQLKSMNIERSNTGELFNTDLTVEDLFEKPNSLKGKKYTYSLIPSSRNVKQKFVKVDGIDDLNALRVQKNRTDLLKEESYYDENNNIFQNSNSNDACDLHDANSSKPQRLQEEDDIFFDD